MNDTAMDYRLAWRWLLPGFTGNVDGHGFSEREVCFLQAELVGSKEMFFRSGSENELSSDICRDDEDTGFQSHECDDSAEKDANDRMLLVDMLRCAASDMPSISTLQSAQCVGILVTRGQAKQWHAVLRAAFPLVHEYGLLPSGNPRVVVPLNSMRHARLSLSLHRPGRWIARLGITLAHILTHIGNTTLLRGRVLLVASREREFIPHGAVVAGLPGRHGPQPVDYALYLGTPDENRKMVVLPLGDGLPEIVIKMAITPRARASLENEAATLRMLAQTSLAVQVPRLHSLVSNGKALALYQEYRPRRTVARAELDSAIAGFLGVLAVVGAKTVPLADYLVTLPSIAETSMRPEVKVACETLLARLQQIGDTGTTLWLHRTHGDFAPWNCTWSDSGLFVFDWEESREHDLALGDAFYYAVAPALLAQRRVSTAKILQATLRLADRVIEASGIELDNRVYLALWLLSRVGKAGLYGELIVPLERGWR